MTEQYQRNHINAPRGSRVVSSDEQLTLDDDLIVLSTNGAPIAVVLPDATQIPALEIKFKADTLTDPATIAALPGQNIDGNASVSLTTAEETICLKSDGENWRQVCGGGGGGSTCCSPVLLSLPDDFPDQQINVAGGSTVFNIQATKTDAAATAQVLQDLNLIGPGTFFVTDVTVVGDPSNSQSVSIEVTHNIVSGSPGAAWVVLTNECGCCQLVGHVTAFFF